MSRAELAPDIVAAGIRAIVDQGAGSYQRIEAAYRKWQAGARPERCKFGREQGIAIDCRCLGCLESMVAFYFDQVAAKFSAPVTRHAKGFQR